MKIIRFSLNFNRKVCKVPNNNFEPKIEAVNVESVDDKDNPVIFILSFPDEEEIAWGIADIAV